MNLKLLMRQRGLISDAKISENDFSNSLKGKAYKIFKVIDGKLYPPMVKNKDCADTPVGVWLEAEEGEFIEIEGVKKVLQTKAKKEDLLKRLANLDNLEGKARSKELERIKGNTLAYRPGWHLGDEPRAEQFDRHATWILYDELPEGEVIVSGKESLLTLAKSATEEHIGDWYYVKEERKYAQIVGEEGEVFFPFDFIWAECEYVMDIDYQEEAHQAGLGEKEFKYEFLPYTETDDDGNEYYAIRFFYKSSKKKDEDMAKIIEFDITYSDNGDMRVDGYPFADLEKLHNSKDSVQKKVANYFLADNVDSINDLIDSGSNKGKITLILFNHIKGDLKHLPVNGSYKYRTNPNPNTAEWVITGAIKVIRLLDDYDVINLIGDKAPERQGGDRTLEEIGLTQV